MRRATSRRGGFCRVGLLVVVTSLAQGCVTRYTLRTSQPTIALQWPYQPQRPKLTYVESWSGLARTRSAGAALKSFLVGSAEADRDGFVLPVAVTKGADARIAVADLGRRCVHVYDPAGGRYSRIVGSERERIVSPVAVVFGDASRLYVSDSAGKVLAFDPEGALLFTLTRAGERALQRPTGLAFSPDRKLLYIVDTLAHQVHAFGADGDFRFSFGGRGDGPGRFNFPTHIFRSASGELYVTDALNFRIGIFDELGKPLGTFGHHGDGSGDLAMPKGVVVDGDGVVYVVDSLFDNVQLFDRGGKFLLTLGKRGEDFGEFWLPSGAFLYGNELYVCDTYNRRIQIFRITERYVEGIS